MRSTLWTLNCRSIYRTSEYPYVEARTLYVDWYTYSTYMRMVLVQRTWNSRLSTHVHYKRQKTWTVMSSKRKITSFFLPTDGNNNTKYKAKLTVELREKKNGNWIIPRKQWKSGKKNFIYNTKTCGWCHILFSFNSTKLMSKLAFIYVSSKICENVFDFASWYLSCSQCLASRKKS
jgi:hypothetical protein